MLVRELSTGVPFIEKYVFNEIDFCDEIINFFKNSNYKTAGKVGSSNGGIVDKNIKESIDLVVNPNFTGNDFLNYYYRGLSECLDLYKQKYTALDTLASWQIVENINIQYYPPGGGYKKWHCERGGPVLPIVNRVLVFMTYLNTIFEEDSYNGGTEWLFQDFKTQSVASHTLIWPVDWPFTHRGITALENEKYIITGWYNFSN